MVLLGGQKPTCTTMKDSILACPFAPTVADDVLTDIVLRVDPLLKNAFKGIPGNTWEQKLDFLNTCKCCTKHQNGRPKKLTPWVGTNPYRKRLISRKKCTCNCRHLARFICRQVEIDPWYNTVVPRCPI